MAGSGKSKQGVHGRKAGIVLEDIDAKLDLVVEKVETSEMSLSNQMNNLNDELQEVKRDVQGLHVVLRQQGEMLKRHGEDIGTVKQSARY